MNRLQLTDILKKYMPSGAEEYSTDLLLKHSIQLHIKKPRISKFGDYHPPTPGEAHKITLNNDLNPFAFLLTFLHEIAHLVNFEKRGQRVMPHGIEWKAEFQHISLPVFEKHILPEDIYKALGRYLGNPSASSCSDPQLMRVLFSYDKNNEWVLVENIPLNAKFKMKNGTEFIKLKKNRTRYTCKEVQSGRIYIVAGLAPCKPVFE